MSANRGKDWEELFQSLCVSQGIDCVRFYDTLYFGRKGPDNPCDFVISRSKKDPSILVECKVCEGSFNIKSKFKQLPRLLELTKFKSYLVIWFPEAKKVYGFSTEVLGLEVKRGLKTLSPKIIEEKLFTKRLILCDEFKRVKPASLNLSSLWKY